MDREKQERWYQLCEQAVVEEDSARLLQLVQEINRLLEEKELRLRRKSEIRSADS